jgi:hypothetical protein
MKRDKKNKKLAPRFKRRRKTIKGERYLSLSTTEGEILIQVKLGKPIQHVKP